jgi:hypothetical protein
MRSFFICISALAFLFSELVGLVQGVSTMPLIMRSVGVFAVFFILGQLFCMFWLKTQSSESDQPGVNMESLPKASEENAALTKKEEVSRLAAGDPKQAAQIINTLISQ